MMHTQMTLRLHEQTEQALNALAAALGLDRSETIRFLIMREAFALRLPPWKLTPGMDVPHRANTSAAAEGSDAQPNANAPPRRRR